MMMMMLMKLMYAQLRPASLDDADQDNLNIDEELWLNE